MTTDADAIIDRIAAALAGRIAPAIPVSIDLWDAERIGAYLKVSARQVAERYACRPDFPRPICLPTGTGANQVRRWKAAEVIAWAEALQARKRAA